MKSLMIFASYAAVTSAGLVGFSSGNNRGLLLYPAPASSEGGSFSTKGGRYSSDFNALGSSGGFTGVQSSFGTGLSNLENGADRHRGGQEGQQGGHVRKFISVHVAPEEEAPREPRIIRAGGPPDTHYNIIFVKAPSSGNQQKTEVVLPEPPKQKTLVYVLIKRPDENKENVKITKPKPTKPSKPEVYFIRYKADSGISQENGNGPRNNGRGFGSGVGDSDENGNFQDSSYGPQNGFEF